MKRKTYLISIMVFCLLALVACSKESLMQDIPQNCKPKKRKLEIERNSH